jgi:perosamine synthetase
MQTIPFYLPNIGQAEIDEVVDTLKSGWLTTGPKTKTFEQEFGAYMRQKHALAVNSCTAALHLALEAIGLQAGDVVVVPTMTFAATAEVVRYFNAQPLLVDCRESDFNLDVADAGMRMKRVIKEGRKVVAIIPVHYGGQIGDVRGVAGLATEYQLKVVEDAAHCCPAYYRESGTECWNPVGAAADITCYSFYANKPITTGEGGVVCTMNDHYADRIRIMSLHGISKDAWKRYTGEGSWYYEIVAPGFKYNMTDVAAAIGLHQLRKANQMHEQRCRLAALYDHLLGEIEEVIGPTAHADRIHSWHLYVLRLRLKSLTIDRAQFIEELKRRGITTSVHWMPLHMHPYYRDTYSYRPEDLPMAASLYREIISLPLFPSMTEQAVEYVCHCIEDIVRRNRKDP